MISFAGCIIQFHCICIYVCTVQRHTMYETRQKCIWPFRLLLLLRLLKHELAGWIDATMPPRPTLHMNQLGCPHGIVFRFHLAEWLLPSSSLVWLLLLLLMLLLYAVILRSRRLHAHVWVCASVRARVSFLFRSTNARATGAIATATAHGHWRIPTNHLPISSL